MGVLYGKYDLLDSLTAFKVRPAPHDPPGELETDTGNFEGMCGVLGALEYIEWVGETFGAEHAERSAAIFTEGACISSWACLPSAATSSS
jgi:selenocysteine lyase/cysteine desulfurase